MSEERYHDALAELEQLKEVAPRESSVYFLMGKIYKRLDMLERAIYHFCIALDLKPSASDVNLIKVRVSMLLFLYFHLALSMPVYNSVGILLKR